MPFDPSAIDAPFRMQPGLRRLAEPGVGVTPSPRDGPVLQAKLAVLSGSAAQALCAVPGAAVRPALEALMRHAAACRPQAWHWAGPAAPDAPRGGRATAVALGWGLDDPFGEASVRAVPGGQEAPHPAAGACLAALAPAQRLAGLLSLAFVEDYAVLDARDTTLPWLAVCLPSHWAPEDKLGRPFAEVHAPVADNRLLVGAAGALARLVAGPQRWERFVWTLTPHGALDGHPRRSPAPAWPAAATGAELLALAWLRTEHQSFLPVPAAGLAVFAIEVECRPLAPWLAGDGASGRGRLRDALASMSPAVLGYRQLDTVQPRLLAAWPA
ncbi:heme-dependent oxidative N-demethylase subunit alpha family protein [Piscinibacter sakaiensis]|uniref:Mlr7324 protein n=1 Tax=Piscinibacter sakaiensis TaxID=1547922 RepID=A0A0K8P4E9_PISS1|nr:heme-dependent oxidative N-demethylase subunit alpha family protein [Piscinibacter sakaiensis]GAP37030.1 Mlr7324 protein [Piscinibacter sakaiensis]